MKKYVFSMFCASLLLFSACGNQDKPVSTEPTETTPSQSVAASVPEPEPQSEPQVKAPPDLTGEWEQVNKNSDDSWQTATIQGDTIEIYWISDGGDTKALYWAGSFEAPTADEPYTWESVNDTEKTGSAMLASSAETKVFAYEDGQISYEASAMGVTQTVRLEKV